MFINIEKYVVKLYNFFFKLWKKIKSRKKKRIEYLFELFVLMSIVYDKLIEEWKLNVLCFINLCDSD